MTCAVAAAWPADLAAASAFGSNKVLAFRAAACAANAALRASINVNSPDDHFRPASIAFLGLSSSGNTRSNSTRTRSATSHAQSAILICRMSAIDFPLYPQAKIASVIFGLEAAIPPKDQRRSLQAWCLAIYQRPKLSNRTAFPLTSASPPPPAPSANAVRSLASFPPRRNWRTHSPSWCRNTPPPSRTDPSPSLGAAR